MRKGTYGRIAYMLKDVDDDTTQEWIASMMDSITEKEAIALDLAGWKIVSKEDEAPGRKWPFDSRRTGCPCPDWCED